MAAAAIKTHTKLPITPIGLWHQRWWDPSHLLKRFAIEDDKGGVNWHHFTGDPSLPSKSEKGWRSVWPRVILELSHVPFFLVARSADGSMIRSFGQKWGRVAPAIGDQDVSFAAFARVANSRHDTRAIHVVELTTIIADPVPLTAIPINVTIV